MSRFRQVSLIEFIELVKWAQTSHLTLQQPLPQLHESQYSKVESCLKTPFQSFARKDLYRGFHVKAAMLFYLFCKNHTLTNGNKRMACLTLGYFAYINGKELTIPDQSFYPIAKEIILSDNMQKDAIVKALVKTFKIYIY